MGNASGNTFLTSVAAFGCALNGGVFFTFSNFVMPALARLPRASGAAAMQAINQAAPNRWFMGVLFGTAALCLGLVLSALFRAPEPGVRLRLVGGALFIVGAIGVTIICNVPRNEALAAVPADSLAGQALWSDYLTAWTAWNHVRTASSLAAAALLFCSLYTPRFAGVRFLGATLCLSLTGN